MMAPMQDVSGRQRFWNSFAAEMFLGQRNLAPSIASMTIDSNESDASTIPDKVPALMRARVTRRESTCLSFMTSVK